MHSWQGYIKLEWKLLIRSRMTQVLSVLTILYAFVIHNALSWTSNYLYYLSQFSFLFLAPFSIVALLYGIHMMRSDRLAGIDIMLSSLPIKSYQQCLAKYFFAILPFLIVSFVPALLYVWHISRDSLTFRMEDFLFLLSHGIPFLYVISIGFLIGALIKGKICYFIGICVWFIHIYGGLFFLEPLLPSIFSLLPNFLLFDYHSTGFFDFMFGFSSYDRSFWFHRISYSAAAVGLIFFLIYQLVQLRIEHGKRLWISMSIIVTIVSISAAVSHVFVRADRVAAYHAMLKSEANQAVTEKTSEAFQVESYHLDVDVQEQGLLHFRAKMGVGFQATTPEHTMTFTLNQALNVEKVMVAGQEQSFQRQGDWLVITLMPLQATANELDIEISYSGKVNDYRQHYYRSTYNSNRNLFPFYVVTSNQINLPAYWGWYPIPGEVNVRTVERKNGKLVVYDDMPLHDNADFHIRITYPQSIPLYSNLDIKQKKDIGNHRLEAVLTGQNVKGSTLLGGPIQEITREQDHFAVRLLSNEYVNAEYAGTIADYFLAAEILMNQLNGSHLDSQKTTTIIPFDQMKTSRPIYNAGFLPVNSYLIGGLFTESEAILMTLEGLSTYNQYVPRETNENIRELFFITCAAYIAKSHFDKPFDFSSLFKHSVSKKEIITTIENDINRLSNEEVLERIGKMWAMLRDSDNTQADFLAVLSNEG